MGCSGSCVAPKSEKKQKQSSVKSIVSLPTEGTPCNKHEGFSSPRFPPAVANKCTACETESHSMSASSSVWEGSTSSPYWAAGSDVSSTKAARRRGHMHARLEQTRCASNGTGKPAQSVSEPSDSHTHVLEIADPVDQQKVEFAFSGGMGDGLVQSSGVNIVSLNRHQSPIASKDANMGDRAHEGWEVDVIEVASPLRTIPAIDCKLTRNSSQPTGDIIACVGQQKVECAFRDCTADEIGLVSAGQPCSAKEVPMIMNETIQMCNNGETELDASNRKTSFSHSHRNRVGSSFSSSSSSGCHGSDSITSYCDRFPGWRSELSDFSSWQTTSDIESAIARLHGHLEVLQAEAANTWSDAADLESQAIRAKLETVRTKKKHQTRDRGSPQSAVDFLIPSTLLTQSPHRASSNDAQVVIGLATSTNSKAEV